MASILVLYHPQTQSKELPYVLIHTVQVDSSLEYPSAIYNKQISYKKTNQNLVIESS